MKSSFVSRLLILTAVLIFSASSSSEAQKMEAPAAGSSVSAPKVTRRLPNNYGKLGLSDEQRNKIYAVQAEYQTRLDSLLQELDDLRSQETLEIQNVLTEQQKKELTKLLEESRRKREARKAKS